MSKADNKPAEEMSMEDILASIRRMIAQDQDVMDASRAERRDDGTGPVADDEVIDLIEELSGAGMTVRENGTPADPAHAWSPLPEDHTTASDHAEDALDLESEFAMRDEDTAEPGVTEAESWIREDESASVVEPVTVGLTDMMEPVGASMPDNAGDIAGFVHEPEPTLPDTADIGAPAGLAEPTLGEPVAVDEPVISQARQEAASMDTPERILSPEAAMKTSTAFDQLARTLVAGYEGDSNTLEGLVRIMLKPLLKEWLDANLPQVVEKIVQAEIRRLTR